MTTKLETASNVEIMEDAAKYITQELKCLDGAVFRVKAYFQVLDTKIGDLAGIPYPEVIKAAEDITSDLYKETQFLNHFRLEILDSVETIADALSNLKNEATNEPEN